MRHDHLKHELELLLLLAQNREYTVDDICARLNMSRRSLYYYINFFKEAGFVVYKNGAKYGLDRSSHFFNKLFDVIQLTEEEALLIRQLIEEAGYSSPRLKSLYSKLDSFYDFKILENEHLQKRTSRIRHTLYNAIKQQKRVQIKAYSSPSSHTVSDRIVEPFLFMNNNNDIRCYEITAKKNKTFRLSRMEDVIMLNEDWQNEELHKPAYLDLFTFSGERLMKIQLMMDQLAHNVMLEEYPASASSFREEGENKWYFETDVCSYLGIGRFILGLYEHITIISDDGLKAYIGQKIKQMQLQT